MTDIDNINHVGMAVRDLPATASLFEKIGFLLTPFSPHSGAWKPGEQVQTFASGNRCIMFEDNYLEILASEDTAKPSPRIANFLKRHQGAHIICFNTEHLESVEQRLKAGGFSSSGIIPLQREIDTPDGVRTAKFQRVQFAPEESAEGYIQAAKHLTPQYIYQARYIAHPNGCDRLGDTIVVTETLTSFVRKYSGYLGLTPKLEDGAAVFQLPNGTRLILCSPECALGLLPGSLLPPLPGIAAVSFRTPDLAAQRSRLQRFGVPFADLDGKLVVPAEVTSGLAFIFEAKQ